MTLKGYINDTDRVTDIHEDNVGNVIGLYGNETVLLDGYNGQWIDAITGEYVTVA